MQIYTLRAECPAGGASVEHLSFTDDDSAICYLLPLARGRLLELWRGTKLIATVDERPCVGAVAA